MKPEPGWPTVLRTGTFTLSKKVCTVSEARMPSLSSFLAMVMPLVFIGTMISDLFLCAWPSPVLASRHIQSAWAPLVVHILPPLITQSPPTRLAVVLIEATSEPAPVSETPRQAT